MRYRVLLSPEADSQLVALYAYIADATSPDTAAAYIAAIIACCDSLSTFPNRGLMRDDLAPGLRLIGFRKRVTITFVVVDDQVDILGIFYGGQDFKAAFQTDDE